MVTDKNIYTVILAGGSGTRFWPLSRRKKPKQFLKIIGGRSLFQETLRRVKPLADPKNIFIVTNAQYKNSVREQSVGFKIPESQILCEPQGKNTAPAICWAALRIYALNPQAIMMVLPSDHLILNSSAFQQSIHQAIALAKEKYLVTLGIVPTRTETGYGYLKTVKTKSAGRMVYTVNKFVEKPSVLKAEAFLKSGNYFWNSGMFVWRADVILEEFRKYLPRIYKPVKLRAGCHPSPSFISMWSNLSPISIDYGIMEKSKRVVTVPAKNLGWSDLGSWQALSQALAPANAKKGNYQKGKVINIDSEGLFVLGDQRLIAAVGVRDMIVVDTPDALLICRKDCSQKVKDVVSLLQKSHPKLL